MKTLAKDVTAERKAHMMEGAKRINELKMTMEALDKVGAHTLPLPLPLSSPSHRPLCFLFDLSNVYCIYIHTFSPVRLRGTMRGPVKRLRMRCMLWRRQTTTLTPLRPKLIRYIIYIHIFNILLQCTCFNER